MGFWELDNFPQVCAADTNPRGASVDFTYLSNLVVLLQHLSKQRLVLTVG